MGEQLGLNRAGRRALQRKSGRSAKRAVMGSGAVLTLGTSLVGGALPAGAGGDNCLDQSSLIVTTPVDEIECDGVTSLREAANFANQDDNESTITFNLPSGTTTVELDNDFSDFVYTYPDGNPDVDFIYDTTVTGPGITIDGNREPGNPGDLDGSRIFDANTGPEGSIDLTVNGLRLTGGSAFGDTPFGGPEGNGGAIRGDAADVVLNGVTIDSSRATNRGGGVFVGGEGSLRVTQSTISGNEASYGGGIFVGDYIEPYVPPQYPGDAQALAIPEVGGVIIDRSTITGNTASITGQKYNDGTGGGLYVGDTHLTMENSTVSGNTAQRDAGGVFLYNAYTAYVFVGPEGYFVDSAILHSTIVGNIITARPQLTKDFNTATGGVLVVGGQSDIDLEHSIVSGSLFSTPPIFDDNLAAQFGNVPWDLYISTEYIDDYLGQPDVDTKYSIIGSYYDEDDFMEEDAATVAFLGVNPNLSPLQNNGGPTPTHRPQVGSPAINSGDPLISEAPDTDQTGGPRIVEGRIDIGAVESRPLGVGDPDPCFNAPEDNFVDVPGEGAPPQATGPANVHEFAVDCITFLGFTIGGPEGAPTNVYGPAGDVSRAQMASYLTRLITKSGVVLNPAPPDAFDDAPTTHDLAINQLALAGIVQGRAPRVYDPTGSVTRAEMATFLYRTYQFITGVALPTGPDAFPDDNGNTHETSINALAFAHIAEGKVDGTYAPLEDVRRDQMASFLTRFVRRLAQDDDFPVND